MVHQGTMEVRVRLSTRQVSCEWVLVVDARIMFNTVTLADGDPEDPSHSNTFPPLKTNRKWSFAPPPHNNQKDGPKGPAQTTIATSAAHEHAQVYPSLVV